MGSNKYDVFYEYTVNGEVYSNYNGYYTCDGQKIRQNGVIAASQNISGSVCCEVTIRRKDALKQESADKFQFQLPDSVKVYDSILSCK